MSKVSNWEENKYKLPILIGFILWIAFFFILTVSNAIGGESPFYEGFMSNLLFTALIVGIPTAIIQIIVAYIFKVVKMQPKSSYDIGKVDDYLALVERFKSGDYEYETIRSKEHLFVAHKMGKKIVFTEDRSRVLI